MRDIIIDVKGDKADGSIMVSISGALFTMDNLMNKDTIHFCLPKDKADKLAHFIQYELQEQEKELMCDDLENQQLKYGEK